MPKQTNRKKLPDDEVIVDTTNISDETIYKTLCLYEAVNLIEDLADRRKVPDDRRWRLYRSAHLKRYMRNRESVIKEQIDKGIYCFPQLEDEIEEEF